MKLILLFLSVLATTSYAGSIPRDELPIPWGQLRMEGCYYCIRYADVTNTLSEVFIEGDFLYTLNDNKWPSSDGNVNAQAMIIMYDDRIGKEEWVVSPWDYMGINQQRKHYDAIGDIPEGNDGWKPEVGDTFYFFLTTVCRDPSGFQDAKRTNVVEYTWFGEHGFPPELCDSNTIHEPPVINSFTFTSPVFVEPNLYLGLNKNYNTTLSWDTTNSDTVKLTIDNGYFETTTTHDSKINGVNLLLTKEHSFTLTSMNECTEYTDWPSETITVPVSSITPPIINFLLN